VSLGEAAIDLEPDRLVDKNMLELIKPSAWKPILPSATLRWPRPSPARDGYSYIPLHTKCWRGQRAKVGRAHHRQHKPHFRYARMAVK